MPTARDRVWAAALRVGFAGEPFRVDDVVEKLGEGAPSRKTIQRTLRGMAETGFVEHAPSSPTYEPVFVIGDPDDEVVDEPDVEDDRDADRVDRGVDPTAEEGDLVDVVHELDLPGSGVRLGERRGAVLRMLDHLDREGETRAGDLREVVYATNPAGYSSAMSLWKNCLSKALNQLREEGVVTLVDGHDGVWRLD